PDFAPPIWPDPLTQLFEPHSDFSHPYPLDPPAVFDLSQQTEHATGISDPGLFWNPWLENGGGVQWDFATQGLGAPIAPVAQVKPTGGVDNVQHRLPSGQAYVRIVSKGRVIYQHPTAGQAYGKDRTRWPAEHDRNTALREGNPWAMWKNKDEWQKYRDAGYSFNTAKKLFKKVRDEMDGFGGPKWRMEDVILPDTDQRDRVTLFFRDPEACGDFLFGQPHFAGKMSFAPEFHYDADEAARLFENPWTADEFHERQNDLPPGTTYSGLLFASDSTQLSTHSGDVAAHAVYMSLANIDKSTQASLNEHACILVAYIPKSKYEHTMATLEHRPKDVRTKLLGVLNRHLFHRCMEVITRTLRRPKAHDVIDPEGNIRSVLYGLAAYIADLEEQWMIAALGKQTCPHCECDPNHLGDHASGPLRTPADILDKIKKIKTEYKKAWKHSPSLEEFVRLAGECHLNGVDKPFWQSLPQLNIFDALSPDLLHGFHKCFHDHIYKFNLTGMGQPEYGAHLQSQLRFAGDRTFLHGVSHISQMTGMEHRMLQRTHLPIVAHAPQVINKKVTQATRR
ncbi:hypothetical protein FRC06_010625, partial [Ceratobasidium sp. 370]